MKWTEHQIAELVRLHGEKIPYRQIGAIIGKSKMAVSGRVSRMNLNGNAKPKDRHQVKPRKYSKIDRGDWDCKTFEPYAIRKIRLALERQNVQQP